MRFAIVALFCLSAAVVADEYTTKYDNVNVDQILSNDRLLDNYTNCLLDKGKCTPDGAELKKILPDALNGGCEKCNDKQKQGSRKVLTFLIEKKQGVYSELEKKYDPTGQYKIKYCDVAKKEGLAISAC